MNKSHGDHTLADIFEGLIEMEYKASKLYTELSRLFSHVSDVSDFWRELAKDEIFHMNTLKEIYKSLTREQFFFPSEKQIWGNIEKIRDILNTYLIDSIKDLDDAYELACQIESSEINDIFKFLVTEHTLSEEQEQLVLSNVMQHHNKLTNFKHKFGDSASRKQIRIQYT